MDLRELEDEIKQTLVDVVNLSAAAPEQRDEILTMSTYYLLEVVKRLKPRSTTRVRVRQLATKAVERRLRNEGANQLKELMSAADAAQEKTDARDQQTVEQEGPEGQGSQEGTSPEHGGVDPPDGERAGPPVLPSGGAGADDAGADQPAGESPRVDVGDGEGTPLTPPA